MKIPVKFRLVMARLVYRRENRKLAAVIYNRIAEHRKSGELASMHNACWTYVYDWYER